MLQEIYKAILGENFLENNHGTNHVIYTDYSLADVVNDLKDVDTNGNLILYLDDFGLPETTNKIEKRISRILCSDYLNLILFEKALESAPQVDLKKIDSIFVRGKEPKSKEEALRLIRKSKSRIASLYYSKRQCWADYEEVPVNILPFSIEALPEACNAKRITVIFDNQNEICDDSKLAVNDIMGLVSTKYITSILSTKKEKWIDLVTSNGHNIVYGYDYMLIDGEERMCSYGK